MKKLAAFFVDRRRIIFGVTVVLAIACFALALTVPVNRDRTRYLPESSRMKQGLAVMESAFPEAEEKSSIRVMFDNLAPEQIPEITARLQAIPGVVSVQHEADSEKYNKGIHTLFIIGCRHDYGSDGEKAVESAVETGFPGYTVSYKNNDVPSTNVPLWIILVALALAVVILLIMSRSWLDPLLILATIGVAVVLNAGTNIVLPYIDEMTFTMGPVLQLTLSLDYSIILLTRYRQEKHTGAGRTEAMKTAVAGSVPSIASSSLTTAVGLLALVFLSFRLGPEMGIVLAKGVVISMFCVLTVLPLLILAADRHLDKTAKKSLRISAGIPCRLSLKGKRVIPVVFAVLLVGSYVLQGYTSITFTEEAEDPLAGIFPRDNTIVLLYRNEDERKIPVLISELEKDPKISGIVSYPTTLGLEMTAAEMTEALGALGGDMQVPEWQVQTLYQYYGAQNGGGDEIRMSIPQFFDFLCDSLIGSEQFAGFIDEETKAQILDSRAELEKAAAQMKGADWSRLVLTSGYPDESPETMAFTERLDGLCKADLGEYYLIGTSVMAREMNTTFPSEHLMITLITAVAIFIVILITFRRPLLPLMLTLVVQCSVFIATAVLGKLSGSMNYLCLLIMQSILMGATIDYGIVFSHFYTEQRKTDGIPGSLKAAYEGSIHTILTSGAVLVIVLGVLGILSSSKTVSGISSALSVGVLISILLILFILPGMIVCFDRLVCGTRRVR